MKLDISGKRRSIALLLVVLMATSGIVAAVGGSVNWDSSAAPNLEYAREETKAVHDMTWGTSEDALRKYEDNSGDIVKMDAELNDSADNPVSFVPTDVNESDWRLFPHAKDDVSAVADEGDWSTSVSDTSNTALTVSDSSTASGVEALNVATGGSMASGDTATATFSNFSITSDAEKRYLQLGLDVNTVDSSANVEFRAVDADGDYVAAEIEPDNSSGENFIANSTGEGFIYQRQTGKMAVQGGGDGSLAEIQKVEIIISEGDADVDVALLNADKLSPYDLGTQKVQNDSDDALETVDVTEKKTAGALALTGLDTLGNDLTDDAIIHGLTIDVVEEPSDQPNDNVYINVNKTDKFPGYAGTATIAVRMEAEDAYDRSIANGVLRDTQSVTSDRVISVEYAEGVPADEAVDQDYLDNRTFSDVTSQYGSEGKEVQLDSSTSQGSSVLVKYTFKYTSDQLSAIQMAGGGDSGGKTSSGLSSIPLVGGLIVALLGWLRKRGE